jgi:hypothetical protein
MLEHWWNVMASLDEDATTDVMRGIGRVDESYAGPLHRSRDASREISIDITVDHGSSPPPSLEEEHTLRRIAQPPPTQASPSSKENVPPTVRMPSVVDAEPQLEDITRADPNLRKLVERELELQRKGKGRG